MPGRAYAYIFVTTAASLALLGEAFTHWRSENITRFLGYFIIAGTAWLPIVMIIIRWMSRPDAL